MKRVFNILGVGLGVYAGSWANSLSSFFLMDFTMYNTKNDESPYYVYPIKFEEGCYNNTNLQLIQEENSGSKSFENAIWVKKNALGKYDPKKNLDKVENPFEVYAFRKIR